jgi:hypothetical protein
MHETLNKTNETGHNPEKQKKKQKAPVSPQGQGKQLKTSFVAR